MKIGGINMLNTISLTENITVCKVCGENTEKIFHVPFGKGNKKEIKVHCMCKCEREREEFEERNRKIDDLKKLSLLDAKAKNIYFENYQVNNNNYKVFNIAKRYVQNFEDMFSQNQGLLFLGDVGTGKSYTAAAIANELINKLVPVVMTSFVKILQDMYISGNSESDYITKLNQAKLLIIDDLGAERGTDYALEKVYDIVDSRYRSGEPVIFTTNLTIQQMKNCTDIRYNRIYDRIFEMCYPVKFDGLSWRKKEAAKRYEDIKKILEG